jgi:hypothetical protein
LQPLGEIPLQIVAGRILVQSSQEIGHAVHVRGRNLQNQVP